MYGSPIEKEMVSRGISYPRSAELWIALHMYHGYLLSCNGTDRQDFTCSHELDNLEGLVWPFGFKLETKIKLRYEATARLGN